MIKEDWQYKPGRWWEKMEQRGKIVSTRWMCLCAEAVRVPLVNLGVVPPLLKLIQSQCTTAIATQVCRALGNICFDNGEFTK